MTWVGIFGALLASHLAGDFLLQTEWQAVNKYGGLGSRAESRRALASHIVTYTLAFAPALLWTSSLVGGRAAWLVAVIAVPHWIQDDGRPVSAWMRVAKKAEAKPGDMLFMAVDQSFHVLALLGASLLAVA